MKKWPVIAVAAAVVFVGHHSIVPSGGISTVSVASGSESAFIGAVLADLGAPATQANVASLASWFPHEFTTWPPPAQDNPMATKMREPGSWDYLSNGVQSFPDATVGAQATAATLDDGYYPGIVAALRSGRGLCGDTSLAGEFLTWSGGGYSAVC